VEDSVAGSRPTISTHVLDTGLGRPAAGVRITLYRLMDDGRALRMTEAVTDDNGRIADLAGRPLQPGDYRLQSRPAEDDEGFFRAVSVDFRITDVTRSYHVPFLVSPFGLTTYLGS
jgi:5-hydroxyisourate hydrolase